MASCVWHISGANTGFGLELTLKALKEGDQVDGVKVLQYDLSFSQEEMNSYAEKAFAAFGRVDVLVNNAGYAYMAAIETDISSIGGLYGYPSNGVYCATKLAPEGRTQALAAEIAPFGMHAAVVEPGFFRTALLSSTVGAAGKVMQELSEELAATVGEYEDVWGSTDFRE